MTVLIAMLIVLACASVVGALAYRQSWLRQRRQIRSLPEHAEKRERVR